MRLTFPPFCYQQVFLLITVRFLCILFFKKSIMHVDYDPVVFLRCHSKNKDSADVQTQVWNCAFEPSIDRMSTNVATCGGNSVCIIDCKSAKVISKYYAKQGDQLFTLSWGMIYVNKRPSKIIVSGGAKCLLYIIDTESKKCLLIHNISKSKKVSISSIHFHPKKKNMFFYSTNDGEIELCEIVDEGESDFELKVHNRFSTGSEIFDLSFCDATDSLLASCEQGLHLFNFPDLKSKPIHKNVILPRNPISNDPSNLVDSVEVLKNGLFASKCALHGNIYICDLKPIVESNKNEVQIEPISILKWSSTDNYFMYMGLSTDKNLLACGDDKGSIWLYDIEKTKKEKDVDSNLNWPNLSDRWNDKKRKLALETYDIVVDKVAISDYSEYIVAVTNNNLVCIWKKSDCKLPNGFP